MYIFSISCIITIPYAMHTRLAHTYTAILHDSPMRRHMATHTETHHYMYETPFKLLNKYIGLLGTSDIRLTIKKMYSIFFL